MSFQPSNAGYAKRPAPLGNCRQCGQRLALRSQAPTCTSCGMPGEAAPAVSTTVERPATAPPAQPPKGKRRREAI